MAGLEQSRERDCTGSRCQSSDWTGSQASIWLAPLVGRRSCLLLVPLTLATLGPPVTHIQKKKDTGLPQFLGVNEAQEKWKPC